MCGLWKENSAREMIEKIRRIYTPPVTRITNPGCNNSPTQVANGKYLVQLELINNKGAKEILYTQVYVMK